MNDKHVRWKYLKNDTQLNPVSIILSFVWEAFALMDLCVCCASVSRRHIRPSEVDWGSGNTVEVRQMRIMGGKSESKWEMADDNRKFHASCWTLYFVSLSPCYPPLPHFCPYRVNLKSAGSTSHLKYWQCSYSFIDGIHSPYSVFSVLPDQQMREAALSRIATSNKPFFKSRHLSRFQEDSQHWRWWWCQ